MEVPGARALVIHHPCRMLGSIQDAEEVAQDNLLRAWEHLGELRSGAAAKSWLYKIAANACLDRLKARRRRALPHQVAPAADPGQTPGPPPTKDCGGLPDRLPGA
ncbi:MAG TPA: sigma factor [Polyangia bacterium]|nr:sigma factor [Polyangia bacterium]